MTSGRPSEVFLGGEVKFTASFRSWLISRGYDVTVVGRRLIGVEEIKPEESDQFSTESMLLPRTLELPYLVYMMGMLFTSIFFVPKIIAVNRRSGISIIHAQDTGYGGLPAVMASKILRVPVVISSHGLRYFTLSKTITGLFSKLALMFEYWLDYVTVRNADSVIVVASAQADFFLKIGVEKRKINRIPVGVKAKDFQPCSSVRQTVRKELGATDDVLVGSVGRLSPEKNLRALLEAFAEASKYVSNAKLILVGGGPDETSLRRMAQDKGIEDRTIFTGVRPDVSRLLSALDIFIIPSFTEGCPTSLLEAMSSSRAIVASDIPSIREIVKNNKEAILVNPYNVEELRLAIIELSHNEELRGRLGHDAAKRASNYDLSRVYPRIIRVYKKLIPKWRCA